MNDQNNAAHPVLTDDEIRSIWVEHGLDDEAVEDFARAIESALLSKLRAPVADGWRPIKTAPQGVRVLLGPRHAPVIGIVKHYEDADSDEPAIVCNVVHYNGTVLVAGYRTGEWAPLASAPVAGEALTRFCPECGLVGDVASGYRSCCPDGGSARMIPASMAKKCRENFLLAINRDAAPQASEAVREFIAAVDALLASEARETWTPAYKQKLTTAERMRIAETYRRTRAALSAQPGGKV